MWGFDPQQGLPDRETVLQRIHPEDRDDMLDHVQRALRERRDYAVEFRLVLPVPTSVAACADTTAANEKAAARGNADSLWHLALMADRGIGMHVDPLQAADRAMTALKKGSTEALALLSDTNQVLTGETLAEIQRVLTARGLYSGPLQMRLSPAAREGLRKWATES